MFHQFIEGKTIHTETPSGADFNSAILALRSTSLAFQTTKSKPLSLFTSNLEKYLSHYITHEKSLREDLIQTLGYSEMIADLEWKSSVICLQRLIAKLRALQNEKTQRLPLGTCLIYGSWSSPLVRFNHTVLTCISLGNSALLLCDSTASGIYQKLVQIAFNSEITENSLTLLSTSNEEALQTLLEHPSIKAIHFSGHTYEGQFLKNQTLPLFSKKIKINFGGKNPVILLNDYNPKYLNALFNSALDFHYLAESRFNRWFVQEKNYPIFLEHLDEWINSRQNQSKNPDTTYELLLKKQNTQLLKDKNWINTETLAILINKDFSNCSAWHQQETLGPTLTITRFKNINEVQKFANTTQYSNAACIVSESSEKQHELAQLLEMPNIFVNTIDRLVLLEKTSADLQSGFLNSVEDFNFFKLSNKICSTAD